MHGKTMREALQEARNYRDPTNEGGPGSGPQKGGKKQSSADIKKAYGILNDPRYKQGNYSGAAKAIDKLSPGLSNHPDVKNAMKRANETLDLPATGDTTTSNASQEEETVELDEAAFSQTQIDALKQKYSGLRGSEKNGIQMDKLAKIMKRYPKSMLDQLAGLEIPMVSKVAKAMTEGGPGSGPQVDVKQKKKDKADTQRLLDRQKRLQSIGKRNEEVVTEAVSAALVNQISRMTDRNNHFGVRIELARIAGDKELMRYYDSLEKMHNKLGGVIGNSAIEVRQKLESVLKNRLQRKFNDKDADRLMGAL